MVFIFKKIKCVLSSLHILNILHLNEIATKKKITEANISLLIVKIISQLYEFFFSRENEPQTGTSRIQFIPVR